MGTKDTAHHACFDAPPPLSLDEREACWIGAKLKQFKASGGPSLRSETSPRISLSVSDSPRSQVKLAGDRYSTAKDKILYEDMEPKYTRDQAMKAITLLRVRWSFHQRSRLPITGFGVGAILAS